VYAAIRIIAALPTLFGVALVTFLMVHLAPGDPITTITQGLASQTVRDQIAQHYGLDQPLHVQFRLWLGRVLQGDFGVSITTGRAVAPELWAATAHSLKIVAPAMLLAGALGWTLGRLALRPRARAAADVVALSLVSLPAYWVGLLGIATLGVGLGLLPVMGIGPASTWSGYFSWAGLAFVVMPAVALALAPAGILAQSTAEVMRRHADSDYAMAMRARHMPQAYVRRRVAANALPSLLALYALQAGYLMGSTILVETVFAWPGLGTYLANAIQGRDMPSIQAALLVIASAFVIVNLVADLLQAALDPRVRR
jgi:peptide/nickel transport system permease protein